MMKNLYYVLACFTFLVTQGVIAESQLVGSLKTRDATIELYLENGETLYSVKSGDELLADKIDVAQLKRHHPALYDVVTEGIAKDASVTTDLVAPKEDYLP